ncbi:MAG: type 1 glutamine amidotransferase [Candidatus Sungbacteria bacterium]|nr:type 1 glutamine amidotransferase [Candidatus Sungbacteria bacterium]
MEKKIKPKILFLDILTDDPKIQQEIFDNVYEGKTYAEAMRKAAGCEESEWQTCNGPFETLPRNITDFSGIIIGGSLKNPVYRHEKPWMKKIYKFIRTASDKQIPILGICGGLQFTARAFGEEVVFNPKGREMGTIQIKATSVGVRDPLFFGLPVEFTAQSSHKCMIPKLRSGWKLLGSSMLCKTQAIAAGSSTRLLQFHPEMTAGQLRALAMLRKKHLISEGFLCDEKNFSKFMRSIKNTEKTGTKILRNFIEKFAIPHHNRSVENTRLT